MTQRDPGYAARLRAPGAALVALTLIFAAVPAVLPAAASAATAKYVGIVIAGKGSACVRWYSGITGDAVLNAVAAVKYRNDGLIVQIDNSPSPARADATHYWSYWHDTGSSWSYSNSGASGYQPKAGTVEGWSYDNGAKSAAPPGGSGPSGLYKALCGAKDAPKATAHSTTVGRSTPSHSKTHPTQATTRRASTVAPGAVTKTPVTRSGAVSVRPTPMPGSPTRSSPAPTSATPSISGTSPVAETSEAAAANLGAAATPLTKPASTSSGTSPWPALVGVALVLLLGAGGGWGVLRRRRADTAEH